MSGGFQLEDHSLVADERWQLAQRIVASPPFQRAERLRTLLLHLVEESIRGNAAQLTEQRIGHQLFGKPEGYSPVDDSSVRSNARLLRLRLHEYYDSCGRSDALILDLPKGSYAPVFRPANLGPVAPILSAPVFAPPPPRKGKWRRAMVPVAVGLTCALLGYLAGRSQNNAAPSSIAPPWPLSEVFDPNDRTQVVISDLNYGLFCILANRTATLEQYISPQYPALLIPRNPSSREARLVEHFSRTSFVSYADTVMTNRLLSALGGKEEKVWVRSARDLKSRDFAEGNFILIGSPASNPWVSLFEHHLNFVEVKPPEQPAYFLNKKPLPGEDAEYAGIGSTGSAGLTYATHALLPATSGKGSVIILQGLHQEGTEAAGRMLTTEEGRKILRGILKLPAQVPVGKTSFEVLIRSKTVGGAPSGTDVLATRVIR